MGVFVFSQRLDTYAGLLLVIHIYHFICWSVIEAGNILTKPQVNKCRIRFAPDGLCNFFHSKNRFIVLPII